MNDHPDAFDLRQLQKWMQSVISHHGGVAAGIESDEARQEIDVSADEVEQVVTRSQQLSSIQRLEIYGNAYYARLMECLRDSFPALVHALGQDVFDEFAFGYLQNYPSRSYTLGRLGDHFMKHLQETRPDAAEHAEGQVDWPDFLIDLATLEWNIEQIFDGPGVEGKTLLDAEQIQAVPINRWPAAVLQPVPCLRILSFRFPVNTYFTQFRGDEQPTIPAPGDQFVALNRLRFVVRRFELEPQEYELLLRIVDGQSIGASITAVAEAAGGNLEELAGQLHGWFRKWTEGGFFEAVKTPGNEARRQLR